MRVFVASLMVVFSLGAWGCGSTDSNQNPMAPTPPPSSPTPPPTPFPRPTPTPPGGSGVVTNNVVGINGAQSFSPDSATLPAGADRGVAQHRQHHAPRRSE
jgi:hypothetical protein